MAASASTDIKKDLNRLQRRSAEDWGRLAGWVIVGLALLPGFVSFIIHSLEVITWPYQIDYDEGLNLSAGWNLAQGRNIYANSVPERFIAAPYPPLYFVLNALGIKIWGIQLGFGRLISFGAALAIGLLIGGCIWLAARRAQVARQNAIGAAIIAGLLWFSVTPVYIWGTFYKQDLLAIAIALFSITLVFYWQDSKYLLWAAPMMALAFFAKQNELLATGVGCGYILVRDWRCGWKLTLATLLWIAFPFGALNLLTKGGYYNHTIGYQLVPWSLDDLLQRGGRTLSDHWILILLGAIYLVWQFSQLVQVMRLVQKGERGRAFHRVIKDWLFPLYLAAGGFSLFTLGAYQGNYNLTLDFFPPLLIVGGIGLAHLAQISRLASPSNSKLLVSGLGIVVVALISWYALTRPNPATYFSWDKMPSQTRRDMLQDTQRQIAATPGDLLTDDVFLALSAGRAVPYDNLYHMRVESQTGKWDDRRFLQDLRDRRFGLVILERNIKRWSDKSWQVLLENYDVPRPAIDYPGRFDLWQPRIRPSVPQNSLPGCSLTEQLAPGRATLAGWSIPPGNRPLKAGDNLILTLYWQADSPFSQDYILYVHLQDSTGRVIAQRDDQPFTPEGILSPFSAWTIGKLLQIDQTFSLPANLPPGEYRLTVGAYRVEGSTLRHLAPTCPATFGDDIILGLIKLL